jgi:hypothetical protein
VKYLLTARLAAETVDTPDGRLAVAGELVAQCAGMAQALGYQVLRRPVITAEACWGTAHGRDWPIAVTTPDGGVVFDDITAAQVEAKAWVKVA